MGATSCTNMSISPLAPTPYPPGQARGPGLGATAVGVGATVGPGAVGDAVPAEGPDGGDELRGGELPTQPETATVLRPLGGGEMMQAGSGDGGLTCVALSHV